MYMDDNYSLKPECARKSCMPASNARYTSYKLC